MRTLILYSSSALFLLLTAAFGVVLWKGIDGDSFQIYRFECIGVLLYIALRILFVFLRRIVKEGLRQHDMVDCIANEFRLRLAQIQ